MSHTCVASKHDTLAIQAIVSSVVEPTMLRYKIRLLQSFANDHDI